MFLPKTALLSVFDKTGVEEFAQKLSELEWKMLASSGTVRHLQEKLGVAWAEKWVKDVGPIVGQPILGHRVVTLSREVHAALLCTGSMEDTEEMVKMPILGIGLVYVNFYPLEDAIRDPKATVESVREKTDIGGPTMVRSAVKGDRLVLTKPSQFSETITFLRRMEFLTEEERLLFVRGYAADAEGCVARYVDMSYRFLADRAFKSGVNRIADTLHTIDRRETAIEQRRG